MPAVDQGHTRQTAVDKNTHICISYSLVYLKYLNKCVLTTNVSAYVKYVNTFACQNYLFKYFKYAKE